MTRTSLKAALLAAALTAFAPQALADVIPPPPAPEAAVADIYVALSGKWENCNTWNASDAMIWNFTPSLMAAFMEGRYKVDGPYLDFDLFYNSQDSDKRPETVATKVLKQDATTADVEVKFTYAGGEQTLIFSVALTAPDRWLIDNITYGTGADASNLRSLIAADSAP
jgi:hypothetical protein